VARHNLEAFTHESDLNNVKVDWFKNSKHFGTVVVKFEVNDDCACGIYSTVMRLWRHWNVRAVSIVPLWTILIDFSRRNVAIYDRVFDGCREAPGVYHMASYCCCYCCWDKTVTSRDTPSRVFSPVISFVNDRRSHFRFYSFSGRRGDLYTVAVILLFSSSLRQSNFTPVYRDYTQQRRCINSYRRATHGRNAWYVVLFKQASHSRIHSTNAIQGGPKSKPAYVCNNFVCCQPIFIIFGTYTLPSSLGRVSKFLTYNFINLG